jgi:hypothetical protein
MPLRDVKATCVTAPGWARRSRTAARNWGAGGAQCCACVGCSVQVVHMRPLADSTWHYRTGGYGGENPGLMRLD